MTGWPAIFYRVDRAEDDFDRPRDDRFDFILPCYCFGTAERDENLAWWVPRITTQCREHDGVARPLPRRRRNRGILPHFWHLGLSRVAGYEHLGAWRLGFHCGCLVNARVIAPADDLRITSSWPCDHHSREHWAA